MVESFEDQARAIWAVSAPRPRPEPVIVVCAYCERMRDAAGEWQLAASRDRPLLTHASEVLVSHGCCPNCLDRELARCERADLPG
jgi:hypothetical protein